MFFCRNHPNRFNFNHFPKYFQFKMVRGGGEKKEKSGYADERGADSGVRITADLIRTNKFDGYSKVQFSNFVIFHQKIDEDVDFSSTFS